MGALAISISGGHSAQVIMRLVVNGGSIPVAQMGPDFLLLDEPFDHPPANASLVLRVDEHERSWTSLTRCA